MNLVLSAVGAVKAAVGLWDAIGYAALGLVVFVVVVATFVISVQRLARLVAPIAIDLRQAAEATRDASVSIKDAAAAVDRTAASLAAQKGTS